MCHLKNIFYLKKIGKSKKLKIFEKIEINTNTVNKKTLLN